MSQNRWARILRDRDKIVKLEGREEQCLLLCRDCKGSDNQTIKGDTYLMAWMYCASVI